MRDTWAWKSPWETNRQVFFSAVGEENVNIVADSKEQLESSWRALRKNPTCTAQRESSCKRVPGTVLIIGTLWKAIFNISSASTQDRSSQWHYFMLPNTPPLGLDLTLQGSKSVRLWQFVWVRFWMSHCALQKQKETFTTSHEDFKGCLERWIIKVREWP